MATDGSDSRSGSESSVATIWTIALSAAVAGLYLLILDWHGMLRWAVAPFGHL